MRKVGASIWGMLKAFGLDQKLVMFVVVPLCVIVGAGLMRWSQVSFGDKTGQRPSVGSKSTQDQAGALAGSLAERASKAISEVSAEYRARSTGEVLCFLAGKGNSEAVQYLLERGQSVNSLDRNGQTPLMHAAAGGHLEVIELLLKQQGVEVGRRDDWGDNVYIHALANERAPLVLPRLKAAGASFPAFDDVPAGGESLAAPREIKEDDIGDWGVPIGLAGNRYSSSDDAIAENNATLVKAIQTIDCDEQVNEPEIQDAAQAERRRLSLLLVNRVIGSRTRAVALYERDKYRHTKLPKPIMDQVKVLRALGTSATTGYATATIMATRKLNAMMLHWMLGKAVRIPVEVEFATREDEQAAAQAAKEKAEREAREEAERAAAAAAYQRPRWTAEPLTEADTTGKGAEDLRDMVWEIYAAAETRFKRDDLNARFRGKGYKQTFDEPQLNGVQKANVTKLRQLRSALEGQSTSPSQ